MVTYQYNILGVRTLWIIHMFILLYQPADCLQTERDGFLGRACTTSLHPLELLAYLIPTEIVINNFTRGLDDIYMRKIQKAVIPAAGLGTRFLPATKAQPKEMLPIVDKPTIQFIVEEAVKSDIKEIIIVTGRSKRAIEDHFDRSLELEIFLKKTKKKELLQIVQDISRMADIYYVRQKEAKGLGHAIYCARQFIGNDPFAVLLGDDVIHAGVPCLKQMINVYERYGTSIVGVQEVPLEDISKYGIVEGEKAGERIYRARDLIEKPSTENAPSTRLAIMGRYILNPEIFGILKNLNPGKGGEIQLTDGLRELNKFQKIIAYEFEGRRYDVGDKLGFIKANIEYGLRHADLSNELWHYLRELVNLTNPVI